MLIAAAILSSPTVCLLVRSKTCPAWAHSEVVPKRSATGSPLQAKATRKCFVVIVIQSLDIPTAFKERPRQTDPCYSWWHYSGSLHAFTRALAGMVGIVIGV